VIVAILAPAMASCSDTRSLGAFTSSTVVPATTVVLDPGTSIPTTTIAAGPAMKAPPMSVASTTTQVPEPTSVSLAPAARAVSPTTEAPEAIPEGRPGSDAPVTTLPPVEHDVGVNCTRATVSSAHRARIAITFEVTLAPRPTPTTTGFTLPTTDPSPYVYSVLFRQQNGFSQLMTASQDTANGGIFAFSGSLPGADRSLMLFVSAGFGSEARCVVDFFLAG
jgi:hypothetical protein